MLKKNAICLIALSTLLISNVAKADTTFLSPGTYKGTYTVLKDLCPNKPVVATIEPGVDYHIVFTLPQCPSVPACDVKLTQPSCQSGECSMDVINKTVSSGDVCYLQKINYAASPDPANAFTTIQVYQDKTITTVLSLVSPPSGI